MHRGLKTRVAAAAAGILLAGCGAHSAASGERKPLPVVASGGLSRQAPPGLARGPLPGPGTTQRVETAGAELAVTLRRVIDPLRGSGAELR